MGKTLLTGFKGKNNSSRIVAEHLSPDHLLLTNSFAGLRKDISSIEKEYGQAVMFGVDKTLTSTVRIEKLASLDSCKAASVLDLAKISACLKDAGIEAVISDKATRYLCNEAYWHVLEKFSGRAVFIHIPTIKYVDESFMDKMKTAFRSFEKCF